MLSYLSLKLNSRLVFIPKLFSRILYFTLFIDWHIDIDPHIQGLSINNARVYDKYILHFFNVLMEKRIHYLIYKFVNNSD